MIHIYQIYYDELSKSHLSPEFIPLDNRENLRPDWAEYWPMRQFLKNQILVEDDFYGFMSAKFLHKTGLSAAQVLDFVAQNALESVDAIVFSPLWGFGAFFKNVFEQAEFSHPGSLATVKRFFALTHIDIDVESLVTHSGNTAFCNYIVAKPRFWRRWLECNEALFAMAENPTHELHDALNGAAAYGGHVHKVFLMERMASALFASEPWRVACYDAFALHGLSPLFDSQRNELIACDALKRAYVQTNHMAFYESYVNMRQIIARQTGANLPQQPFSL